MRGSRRLQSRQLQAPIEAASVDAEYAGLRVAAATTQPRRDAGNCATLGSF